MKWSYDLTGSEPIIKDMPVYDATTLVQGELLMLGTSAFTAGADAGYGLVSAYTTTVMSAAAVKAVGINLATKTTNAASNTTPPSLGIPTTQNTGTIPSVATALNITTGVICVTKVIVNPFAVYKAEVTTADGLSIASSSGTTMFTVTGVPVSSFNGSYVYFCASAGPNFGSIRKCISSATAGTILMDKAVTNTITTADKVILIAEQNAFPHMVSADAVTIGQTTVGSNGVTTLRVVDNVFDIGAGHADAKTRIHSQVDLGTNIAKRATFYQEIMMINRLFS
jgi:hypothetical protein